MFLNESKNDVIPFCPKVFKALLKLSAASAGTFAKLVNDSDIVFNAELILFTLSILKLDTESKESNSFFILANEVSTFVKSIPFKLFINSPNFGASWFIPPANPLNLAPALSGIFGVISANCLI